MTIFDQREQAFERKFVNGEDVKFRARARRNKMLALWVCSQLGSDKEHQETYVRELVGLGSAEGCQEVLNRVYLDLSSTDLRISKVVIWRQMEAFTREALVDLYQTG